MSRRLWINAEVRDWLSGLRARDPSAARLAGEAVLGLLEESPRPPLAVPADLLLWTEDPSAALEFAYQRRLAALRRLRRPAADVATARKRLELRVQTQEAMVRRLGDQSRMADEAGRHDIAQETRERQVDVEDSLSDLRRDHAGLRGEEEKALRAIARLRDKLEHWRAGMEKARAAYVVRHGGDAIESALAEAGEGPAVRARPAHTAAERSAIEALLESAQGLARDPAEPTPHLHELRLGPLTGHDLRVLFAVEPPGAVHLLAARGPR
ncbi:MAG: PspA/IM30 family protein [Actinoallomurus sp.]